MNKLEKGKHNPSLEEFIEGASKETTAKKANIKQGFVTYSDRSFKKGRMHQANFTVSKK